MLHYRISTHQYFYFYVTTSECWQYLWIVPLAQWTTVKLLFAHSRVIKCIAPRTDASTRCPPSFFFLLSGMMAPHANYPETPRHCPDHTISTALLSGSCVSYRIGAHAWSNEPQSVSRFSAEMRLSLWHEPYAEETVPSHLSRDKKLQCSDLGGAKWEKKIVQ